MNHEDAKLSRITDPDNKPRVKPIIRLWTHPDAGLSEICLNAAAMGIPPARIAKMVKVDLRTLKNHYQSELEGGRDLVSTRLHEVALEMACRGHEKPLLFLLKHNSTIADRKTTPEVEEEVKRTQEKLGLDPSKLTKDELIQLYSLMEKAKPCIQVEHRDVTS